MELAELVAEHESAKADVESCTVALMTAQERLKESRKKLAQALELGNGGSRPKPISAPFDQAAVHAFLKKQKTPVLIRQVNTALGIHATRADMEDLISAGKVVVTGTAPGLYYQAG